LIRFKSIFGSGSESITSSYGSGSCKSFESLRIRTHNTQYAQLPAYRVVT
jgi:hypothetical protein